MKYKYGVIYILILLCSCTTGEKTFRRTQSSPELKVVSVSTPTNASQPLIVQLDLSVKSGKDPISVSPEWLTVKIYRPKDEWNIIFDGDVQFVGTNNTIATVESEKISKLTLAIYSDRFTKRKLSNLLKGKYRLRVYLNGSKTPEHDYQWLGQTYSAGFDFEMGDIPNKAMDSEKVSG